MTENTGASSPAGAVAGKQYRRALRTLSTSVVVASAMVSGEPRGMVVSTFCAVSLDPPLVGFFGSRYSPAVHDFLSATAWSFCVLGESDMRTAIQMRGPQEQRFDGVRWVVSASGTPHLTSSLLTIDAVRHSVAPAGDRQLILGAVNSVRGGDPSERPIHFRSGRLAHLESGEAVDEELWQLGWIE